MVIRIQDDQGRLHTFGRFEEGHLLRLTDLLPDGQAYGSLVLKSRVPPGGICRLHRVAHTAVLYRKVVADFLSVVLDELILNFSFYHLPVGGGAVWKVMAKSKDEVKHIARNDTYKFVDLHKTRGRIFELVMLFRAFGRQRRRLLRVDYRRYQRLCALAQTPPATGRHPRHYHTRELALRLSEHYPHLEPESIVTTCVDFMRLLFSLVRRGLEVRLTGAAGKYRLNLKIYKVNFNFTRVNYRALRGASRRRRERWVRQRRVFFQRELKIEKLPALFELNPK